MLQDEISGTGTPDDASLAVPATRFGRELGANLRAMRMARHLSLKAIERRFPGSIKASTLRSWEAGGREIPIEKLAGLAAFYGVATASLIPPV